MNVDISSLHTLLSCADRVCIPQQSSLSGFWRY